MTTDLNADRVEALRAFTRRSAGADVSPGKVFHRTGDRRMDGLDGLSD